MRHVTVLAQCIKCSLAQHQMHLLMPASTMNRYFFSLPLPHEPFLPSTTTVIQQPLTNNQDQSKAQQQHNMADTIALHCRIAALETELRLVKEELATSQNGGTYLVSMLGRQSQLAVQAGPDHELQSVRARLEDALQCNSRLESMLASTQQENSLLETMEESPVTLTEEEVSGDLLSWNASEEGVRDGWASMDEKSGQKGIPVVVEPAVDNIQVERSDEKKDEVGTAHSIHMRSYSREEVKHYDVQPTAPLQHSQWALPPPGPRWPLPQPRQYMRRPYNAGYISPSYEVTNSIHSKDPGLRRTVLVTKIPVGMLLSEVLDLLKSDRILEASFAGTAGMKTSPPIESNAAIVEFLDNEDAQMFVDFYAKHHIFELMLVETPTRPLRRARVDSGYC